MSMAKVTTEVKNDQQLILQSVYMDPCKLLACSTPIRRNVKCYTQLIDSN
jgi:hypothetical protein